ncbi:AAA family ATPase [Bacillus toyonensis]|uniref:AAA family ATPase n=1 Tax=Bacillus toyonensis TaxID=155322 RepID=UPI00124EDFB6|nr:AAA family ATPase [Bacillus toyonensis]KAB2357039.1 AAA family ATPase [Bacillus toyonensis]
MGRELIYVYIENLNECFINQGFNFSSNFEVNFDIKIGDLSIKRKSCNVSDYFRNNKIKSINLIVGKNGSGKSTILDLLGLDKISRIDLMANSKSKNWFAVYHIKDNYYVIEGNDIGLIKNIDNKYKGDRNDFAIVIKNEDLKFKCVEFIQDFNNERDKLLYLYNVTAPSEHWYSNRIITDGNDVQLGYQRRYLMTPLMQDVYRMLNNSIEKIDNKFAGRNVSVRISKRNLTSDINILESIDTLAVKFKLYNDKVDVLSTKSDLESPLFRMKNKNIKKWSVKERFIIEFLEESIFYRIIDNKNDLTSDDLEKINKINYPSNRNTYQLRINYLKEILDVLDNNNKTNYFGLFKKGDYDYGKIISLLENIDKNCYSKKIIKDHIYDSKDKNNILKLIEFFDATNEIREIFPLKVEFLSLSSGELQFIKHLSNLSKALNIASLNEKIENIIILLDEPDANFHPEWSRRYIANLIEILNSKQFESEIQFQIIITTHSPFMISDIPKQYITCIDVIEDDGIMKRAVYKSEFGLMSNFYDLIKNNFFMEQPIGEYASKFFNEIISNINILNAQYSREEFLNIEKKIELIDDQIIKSKLLSYFNKKTLGLLSDKERLIRKRERLVNELEEIEKELEND